MAAYQNIMFRYGQYNGSLITKHNYDIIIICHNKKKSINLETILDSERGSTKQFCNLSRKKSHGVINIDHLNHISPRC